eukprot:TRINITY_DN72941_c0_g1_i1.p1 TRINITY_DN72941_c0_g1~~TRINITY_DN72941_c0_g1_i1.p1  ORF type:complete len:524 (+),score=166.35 TRINITY_DN72941_c0_g1_i1:294-1865(+)
MSRRSAQYDVAPQGNIYAKSTIRPSEKKSKRASSPKVPLVEKTEYLRVPEGTAVKIGRGEIKKVLSALYRVEGGLDAGVEKDVTDMVRRRVEKANGGLVMSVNNETMGIRQDPYKGRKKVLIITYVPMKGGVAVQLAQPVGERDRSAQFVRVPEHSHITIPKGTIVELLTADFRVEGSGKIGMQKDVFGIVKSHIKQGGLDLVVSPQTMQLRNDPFPEKEKVLVISYTPLPEPAERVVEIREGGWLEVPEGTIARLIEADFRLPFHEEVGHGYAVDVEKPIRSMVENGGISGRYVTQGMLGIDYDPFPDYTKVLRIHFMPHRRQTELRTAQTADSVLDSAERILASNTQGFRCTAGSRGAGDLGVFRREMNTARSLLHKVRKDGGWGEDKLAMADSLLKEMSDEAAVSQTRMLIDRYNSGQLGRDTSGDASSFKDVSLGGHASATYPVPEIPEPNLPASAAYHVGTPLGMTKRQDLAPASSCGRSRSGYSVHTASSYATPRDVHGEIGCAANRRISPPRMRLH